MKKYEGDYNHVSLLMHMQVVAEITEIAKLLSGNIWGFLLCFKCNHHVYSYENFFNKPIELGRGILCNACFILILSLNIYKFITFANVEVG